MKPLTIKSHQVLADALSRYGTYSFDFESKGSYEVLCFESLVEEFRQLPAEEAKTVLLEIYKSKNHGGRGQRLVEDILDCLEDWDELMALGDGDMY